MSKKNMHVVQSPTGSGHNVGVGRSDSQPNLPTCGLDNSKELVTSFRQKRKLPDENDDIRTELSGMRKQMEQMMEMLTSLTFNQNEFTAKIHGDMSIIKEQMLYIKTSTDNLIAEQNTIKSELIVLQNNNLGIEEKIKEMQNAIDQLHSNTDHTSLLKSSKNTPECIIAEINEREIRSKNIIISGITESVSSSKEERIRKEKDEVLRILKMIHNICPEPHYIRRLGKFNPHKTRPIKVCFTSQDTAKLILRKKTELKLKHIKIYSDQTPQQQQFLKCLKDELQQRKHNENEELTIKYFNGIPKIIKTLPKNDKH